MKTVANGGGHGERQPFVPSESWIDAFEEQACAADFIESTARYARMRSNMVAHAGRTVDDLYARELVQDALDDTLEGVLAWDPDRVTLQKHVLDAIKSRTRHDFIHARRFRHVSLEPNTTSEAIEEALTRRAPSPRAEVAAIATRVLGALRTLARADPDVLLLLDAYDEVVTKKADVMRASGLTAKRYEAARKRMQRLVLQLPPDLQDAARTRT